MDVSSVNQGDRKTNALRTKPTIYIPADNTEAIELYLYIVKTYGSISKFFQELPTDPTLRGHFATEIRHDENTFVEDEDADADIDLLSSFGL